MYWKFRRKYPLFYLLLTLAFIVFFNTYPDDMEYTHSNTGASVP